MSQPAFAPGITLPAINADAFTATAHVTAEEKARQFKGLCQFVLAGCPDTRWKKSLYHVLRVHFGHMAHYDQDGFYNTWFADRGQQLAFVEHHAKRRIYGDAGSSWSDVEQAFQDWLNTSGIIPVYIEYANRMRSQQNRLAAISALQSLSPADRADVLQMFQEEE